MNSKLKLLLKNLYGGLSLVFFAFATIFLYSCGSTKNTVAASSEVSEFSKKQLSNGIPVIFKQNRGSKIVVLKMVFEGGTSAIDRTMSGIENLTLDLMLRGSEKYPYAKIQQLEYEKSFSFSSSSGKDYSTIGFVCIQRDLAEVLDIFSECLMHPQFLESDFNQKMVEAASAISARKADPSGALGTAITKSVFKNHPYETSSLITEDSLPNIKLNLVLGTYQELLSALRIKIIVVGNFNSELINDFTGELEASFGSIQRKAFSLPKIPKVFVNAETLRIANEQAGDTGYVAGLFSCPSRNDADYIPFAIATMYLDDLLFSQVREKAGAVYSINTGVLGGKEFVAVLSGYKVTDKENFKKAVFDTILSYDEKAIEQKLSQYKNKYISSLFSSSQSASGVASNIISSIEYYGAEDAYMHRVDSVQSVNARQVIDAYKKYVLPVAQRNNAQWVIVDGKDNLQKYDF